MNKSKSLPVLTYEMPETKPERLILFVHGLGQYSRSFIGFSSEFLNNGFGIAYLDFHGHGKAPGIRGHASLRRLKNEIDEAIKIIRAEYPGLKLYIYAHSMGALVVLSSLAEGRLTDVSGVILSSPWLRLYKNVPAAFVKTAALLAHVVPFLTVNTRLKAEELNNTPLFKKSRPRDPLLHKRISMRLFNDLWKESIRLRCEGVQTYVPILILLGHRDRLMNLFGAIEMMANSSTMERIGFKYSGHELHTEIESLVIPEKVIKWIDTL